MKRFNKQKLFTPAGYYDIEYILSLDYPFTFLMGPRGTGKTYGVNNYILDRKQKFIYLRRTGTELDIAFNDETNPLQVINPEVKAGTIVKNLKGLYIDDELIGYGASLSTFHNLRGVNFEDVNIIVYDECIPETHAKAIKNEYNVVLNMYETVNRNRELDSRQPVKLVLLSNSNNLTHPLIVGLGLSDVFYNNHGIYIDNDRGLLAINEVNKDFRKEKQKTALYRLTKDNKAFQKMALDNDFTGINNDDILKDVQKRDFTQVCRVKINDEVLHVLRHKGHDFLYITSDSFGGGGTLYDCDIQDSKMTFNIEHSYIIKLKIMGLVYFNSQQTKLLFDTIIKK